MKQIKVFIMLSVFVFSSIYLKAQENTQPLKPVGKPGKTVLTASASGLNPDEVTILIER